MDTHLRLSDLEAERAARAPIDHCFRTLADTHDGHSVAVILTGTGSDGALGLRRVEEKSGLTIVQDPDETEYRDMPQAAIDAGMADLVLELADIPAAIAGLARTAGGAMTGDLYEIVREELRFDVRGSVQAVLNRGEPAKSAPVPLDVEGRRRSVRADVRPTSDPRHEGLQSINEELVTVNEEHRHEVEELAQTS